MLLNVTDVLTTEGKAVHEQFEFAHETISYGGEEYKILEKSPVSLDIVHSGKGRAKVNGAMKLVLQLSCDRCLKHVSHDISLEFSTEVLAPELGAAVSEEEADTYIIGVSFDVDDLVYSEISINWPMKILCKSDCKGICRVCGKDLNEGACECDTFVPDPRMAVIKDIFNAGKEV